ncbi:16S rRNA pseudouridine(516) synthase RsuA [Pusillimonas sp. ANT_WB101]|uniref:16S rRNA pseudouridine(516) synthase RsuA n=1 Tax=Pusillimonas sp. ANT_WB101 TaxID=2597356 RepID=UPI0011EF4349|nr:16S rRNA pseudouridine(516) synthase RsuA [Pusillimonas sp. ANT_WB101]KAA0911528.1 16S rRNA pseudouridine(516) synthase RsuA [Pusillimonas sp. ANT_WB101]
MRLDKYLCESSDLTRSLARSALARGEITVNGEVVKRGTFVVREGDQVQWDGETLEIIGLRYIMLNKPAGYECSLKNSQHLPVMDLLDVDKRDRLHTVGRLDVDTTGLILITDDGQWTHRIISPRHRCDKVYLATLAEPLSEDAEERFAAGILLEGEDKVTLPAVLERVEERLARLTIQEGKYHQVRRMFAALGNHVTALHRERIGPVALDDDLQLGESRYLTPAEVSALAQADDTPA